MTLATTLFPVPQQSEIVIAGNEHGNAVAGWIGAARSASLIHAVPPDTQKILERITARTSIVCLPQVHWITGARFDLEEVGRHARAVGAKLIVDGTQSVGAMPFDIDVIQPDMLCVSGYKWLLGPRGVTYIYLPPKHHGLAPMENSWSNRSEDHSARFDASGRAIYDAPWLEGARRFDAGGHNSLLLACAFEGLEVIHRLTPNAIQTRLAETNRWIAFQNPELTFDTHGDAVTHIVSLAVHNRAMVMELLRENGVFASLRGNRLRLSGHYWNTANDFDLLSEFLKTLKP